MQDLVVMIVATSNSTTIASTLSSLARVHLPECFRETRIIENGPGRGLDKVIAAAAPHLRIVHERHLPPGKSRALNLGLELCRGCLVYFADDDVRFESDVLLKYVEAAEAEKGRAFFGGPTGVDYEVIPRDWLLPYLPPSAKGWQPEGDDMWFLGFNWAAYADDILSLGGFDESLGPGAFTGCTVGDETDMQFRLRGAGVTPRYVSNALVHHKVPRHKCTPQWTVRRQYISGFHIGFTDPEVVDATVRIPRWMWRRAAELAWSASWARLIQPEERSFVARVKCARFWGAMRGRQCRRRLLQSWGDDKNHVLRVETPHNVL